MLACCNPLLFFPCILSNRNAYLRLTSETNLLLGNLFSDDMDIPEPNSEVREEDWIVDQRQGFMIYDSGCWFRALA